MKLYTPAEIATFVAANDLGQASEREVVEALKQWETQMRAGTADGASALFAARRDAVRVDAAGIGS